MPREPRDVRADLAEALDATGVMLLQVHAELARVSERVDHLVEIDARTHGHVETQTTHLAAALVELRAARERLDAAALVVRVTDEMRAARERYDAATAGLVESRAAVERQVVAVEETRSERRYALAREILTGRVAVGIGGALVTSLVWWLASVGLGPPVPTVPTLPEVPHAAPP